MNDNEEQLELWPDEFPRSRPTRVVRFSPSPRANNDDVTINYRYVPRPKTPPKEPKVWLGRTKAEVAEDNKTIAKREAAQREAEEEEEVIAVVRRRQARSPSPEPYVYTTRTSSRSAMPNFAICSTRDRRDPGPPPKTPAGPKNPKDDEYFYVRTTDGETVRMKYSSFKSAEGHWMQYPKNLDHWYYVLH